MITSQAAKEALKDVVWEDGKIEPIVEGPYRYRIMVLCTPLGSQKALFANGEFRYFCYIQCLSGAGVWNPQGGLVVPVLPDGKILMTVQQRPAQGCYKDRPLVAEVEGQPLDLAQFGPYSSLEFPGGGVDPSEGLKAGFLRELAEETGVARQTALYYHRCHPVYAFGSDVAGQNFIGVAFLSGLHFERHVATDGGMVVLALSRSDVEKNVRNGVIHSANGAIIGWDFYRDVERARQDQKFLEEVVVTGYLRVEKVVIKR